MKLRITHYHCPIEGVYYQIEAFIGILWWKKWKPITFGPFGPNKIGIIQFYNFDNALDELQNLWGKPKSFIKAGL